MIAQETPAAGLKDAAMARPSTALSVDIRPILFQRANADAAYREDIGHTQRFLERFAADARFREMLAEDAPAAARHYGLLRDPDEIRYLWDRSLCGQDFPCETLSQSVRRYRAFIHEKIKARHLYRRDSQPAEPRFAAWRSRQIERCISHLGARKADALVHAPFCIELGKGCSVGCWFCAVSAGKMGDQLPYTPETRRLWRECLQVLRDVAGDGARGGYCYWGNDPLDNPDYEQFLVDFHEIIDAFPQTTTAQAEKHVARVKRLLDMAEERGGVMDRFSVITLKAWNRIHEAFTPSEMIYVECVPQNKEAYHPSKSVAGRAYQANRKLAEKGKEALVPDDQTSTIACVSGFYINMVDRAVELISPCHASDRWPNGYWIFDRATFVDAAGLERAIRRMVDQHMRDSAPLDDRVRFRRDLRFEEDADGLCLSTRYRSHRVAAGSDELRELGRRIHGGTYTAAELALSLLDDRGTPPEETLDILRSLRDRGLLDEEPAGRMRPDGSWIKPD